MNTNLLGEPFAFKNTRLCLSGKVEKRLLAEAQEAFPIEYSALLCGQGATITDHVAMPAWTSDEHSFSWDGPSFLRALRQIDASHLQWLGILHSHPHSPPVPSARDREGWHYPMLSYWILGLAAPAPQWRVYQWQDGRFVERAYRVMDAI